jgi:hypothetical protein
MSKVFCLFDGSSMYFAKDYGVYDYINGTSKNSVYKSDTARRDFRYHTEKLKPVTFANWANPGDRISHMTARAAEVDALIRYTNTANRTLRHYILVIQPWTNAESATPATQLGLVRDYCLARQAAGWKVAIAPCPSRTDGVFANYDTSYKTPVNTGMAAWTEADGVALVVPIYYDAEIYANGAASNTTYFSDGVHPTQAGATLIASGLTALDDLIENLP